MQSRWATLSVDDADDDQRSKEGGDGILQPSFAAIAGPPRESALSIHFD
jgi:hypothetical protein